MAPGPGAIGTAYKGTIGRFLFFLLFVVFLLVFFLASCFVALLFLLARISLFAKRLVSYCFNNVVVYADQMMQKSVVVLKNERFVIQIVQNV